MPPSTISRSTPTARSTAPWRKTASSVSTGHPFPQPASPGSVGRRGWRGSLARTNCVLLQHQRAGDGGYRDGAGRGGGEAAPASPPARPLPRGRRDGTGTGDTPSRRSFRPLPSSGSAASRLGVSGTRRPVRALAPSGSRLPLHPRGGGGLDGAAPSAPGPGRALPSGVLRGPGTRPAAEGLSPPPRGRAEPQTTRSTPSTGTGNPP